MKKHLEGRVLKLDKNIDWKLLIVNPAELPPNQTQRDDMPRRLCRGDIVVAGKNFGWPGEDPAKALSDSGTACVIAASYARAFYRNCINLGIPLLECADAYGKIGDEESIAIDFDANKIISKRGTLSFRPQPEIVAKILASGGLAAHIKRSLGK